MTKKVRFFNKINVRILATILVLFTIAGLVVSMLNLTLLQSIYEDAFTEKVLMSNQMMASLIDSDDVRHYVELMTNQDDDFKQRQKEFGENRDLLVELQNNNAPSEEQDKVISEMQAFYDDLESYKTNNYNRTLEQLRKLKISSGAKYVYIFADTGIRKDDGTVLYTFIFDAGDDGTYNTVDSDGLGTISEVEPVADEVYQTKSSMKKVHYYNNEPYGELYFAYSPILDKHGEVTAIIGTDIDLGEMNNMVRNSMILNTGVFMGFVVLISLIMYFFINGYVAKPLGLLTNTALELADGDVYSRVPDAPLKLNNELGLLAHAIDDMSSVYQNMIISTGSLFEAANIGLLDVRNDLGNFKGDIAKVMTQINATLDAITLYLNSLPESILIIGWDLELFFRNEKYTRNFHDQSAEAFLRIVLPSAAEMDSAQLRDHFTTLLNEGTDNFTVWIDQLCYSVTFIEINPADSEENNILVIAVDITDLMNEKENAQAAARAKSAFLSRMSHEMRTPMNAIIGMTKIADSTDDINKLKFCLSTIGTSSTQLLGIINDVLDMSKIEAGKFDLDHNPMNLEKILMKISNLLIDKTEQKNQNFSVHISPDICLNYIGDELRLSQVLTNLLSNAVKFTPDQGSITLSVVESEHWKDSSLIRFSVADSGIGMTEEQISRLFTSFEQADGSISRRFGGTGLGLAISKSIVEKMDGRIWVESKPNEGSTFYFEVSLVRSSCQNTVIFDGIRPSDIRLLILEPNQEMCGRFRMVTEKFGIHTDQVHQIEQAVRLIESAAAAQTPYDMVFLDYHMPETDGISAGQIIQKKVNKNTTVVMICSFMEWNKIEVPAAQIGIQRFISNLLFPSEILDTINEVVGNTLKNLNIHSSTVKSTPDFSGITVLLVEDIEINQEIFITLLEDTRLHVDTAENGLEAVTKFREHPDKYAMIIMDIQMPEMDGYQATRGIRAMNLPRAKTIPIIAMTANAFKEDVEHCLECGMNDHLAKPIDEKAVIEKISLFANY